MPNWCDTDYRVIGPGNEIRKMKKHLEKAISKELHPSDFHASWLGNVALEAGIDWNKIPCRGTLDYIDVFHPYSKKKAELQLSTTTAWCPTDELIYKVAKKYAPNAKMYYIAVEPGCEIYETNDAKKEVYKEDYYVDGYFDNHGGELEKELGDFFRDGISSYTKEDLLSIFDQIKEDLKDKSINFNNCNTIEDFINRVDEIREDWKESFICIYPINIIQDKSI